MATTIALVWLGALVAATIGLVLRGGRGFLDRVLAFDTIALLLVAILAVSARAMGEWYALDAALVVALLSFVGTLAAIRYAQRRDLLR